MLNRVYRAIIGLKSNHYGSRRTLATVAMPAQVPAETTPQHSTAFKLYTKSHIHSLFKQYAPHLDPVAYLAAAQVFPMRANNYVVENLIDWLVSCMHLEV